MFLSLKTAAFAAFSLMAASANAMEEGDSGGAFQTGLPCKPCEESDGDCTVDVRINYLASETGR